jgi:Helix-turn-helix domain/NB-ARC domain
MGRPEKPVDATGGVVAAFASELRRLRAQAGNPTYRDMARSALFSSSVLSSAASGRRLPTLPVTLAFVEACGGDREAWRRRWQQVSGAGRGPRPAPAELPARSALPRPAQLPLRPRGFVGRMAELCRLGEPSATPVVISGPVGVGKTELALRYAHDIAAAMVDGQLYADVGMLAASETGAAAVLDGFLRALGVPTEQIPATLDQRAGLYRSLLAERRLVVLLDNVRDERQVRPLLAETRRSVTILVSRRPLLGLRDVRRVRLDVLSRNDSLAMIMAAVPDRMAADPAAGEQLAELCGDLPLALDIALRKLVAWPDLPLRRVIGRLAGPGATLDWLRAGDLCVGESLSSAYLGLSDPARAALQRLALLPAGAPLVWADPVVPAVDKLVEELTEAGMLRRGNRPGGYRMDALVRAFVLGMAPQSKQMTMPRSRPVPLAEHTLIVN